MNKRIHPPVRGLPRVAGGGEESGHPLVDDESTAAGAPYRVNVPVRVLIVEDSEDDMKLVLRALHRGGFAPAHRRVQTAAELKAAMAQERWDAVVSDFAMPGFSGLDALRMFRATGLDIPFILISGTIGEETAVEAMKAGASDYVMKNSMVRLAPALERELKETQIRAAHRQAQRDLVASESRFRSLTALSSDWFWEQDEAFRFVAFSGGERDAGWGSDQLRTVGLRRWELDGVVPVSGSWDEHKALLEAHKPYRNFEYRRILGDGSLRYVAASGEPVFDPSGRFTGYRGVATNITGRKRSEQELRESERRFSDLLKNVELVSVMLDREAGITYCNEYLLHLTGWKLDEVIGRNWFEVFVPAESGDMKPVFDSMLTDLPEARHRDNRIVTRSGERRLIRWSNSVLRSGDGNVIGTASIGEDITEQTRSEESLRRFSAAMDAMVDAIYLVDRSSMGFVYVNDAACRMTNTPREQLMARNPWEILAISRAELEHSYDTLIAGGVEATPVEMLRPRTGGSKAWVELRRHAQRSGDRWTIVTLVRDVTERHESEAKILRLNRVYAVLSGINSAIVRIRERGELFTEACRIAVTEGGFIVARVIELDSNARARIAATSETDSRPYQLMVDEYNNDPERCESLLARALCSGQPQISNDVASDPRIPNRAVLAKQGSYALALLPMIVGERVAGAIVLRAREAGMFDQEELRLLLELTGNISLALDRIEKEEKLVFLAAERARGEEALRRFSTAMDATVDAIYIVDRESMRFVHVNEAACRMQGRTREELLALGPEGVLSTPRAELERTYDAMIASGVPAEPKEMLRVRQDGSQVWVELRRHAQRSTEGWTIVTLVRDVTERKAAEARIKRLNRVYAVLSGINTLIVRVSDRDELFSEACRIAVEAGHFAKAWLGIVDRGSNQFRMVAAQGGDPLFFPQLEAELSRKFLTGSGLVFKALATRQPAISNHMASDPEVLMKDHADEGGAQSLAILPLIVAGEAVGVFALNSDVPAFFDDEEMKLLVELAGDIAFAIDHIDKQSRLDYFAYYDEVTGLANRSLFLERVAQYTRSAAAAGHKLAVFFLDIERFKNINDSLGRPAGDALLKQVGEWLTVSGGDPNLAARVGADHFAMVLPEVKNDGNVARLVENSIDGFSEHPFRLNDAVFRIAVKAGVALFPNDGADAETLLRNAEVALKKAKARGERYLFYKQKMTDTRAGTLTLENKLRSALENEEYVLHYQPKVSFQTGKLTSAEALIRWNDPQTGLVPPGHFISILEETGLIHDVGRWALRRALEDYLRWRAAGLPAVRIAVNVSPLQLRDRGFIAEVAQAIGIDPHAAAGLELEITESLIMADVKHSIAILQEIRDMKVTIAIDDFGTGFSSLAYLAKLPVDTLKIDRSFVIDMTAGPNGLALVSTIINLAHSLKLKVVAEGVETEEQSRLLRLLNCDEMQGYLFSRPVPAEDFEAKFLAVPAPGEKQAAEGKPGAST